MECDRRELEAVLPHRANARKKRTYEWTPLVNEAWKFALSRNRRPTQSAIARHVADYCVAKCGGEPDSAELIRLAREILDFIDEKQKLGEIYVP